MTNATAQHEKLLTRYEVAELVGLSVRSVDEHVARGALKPIRLGRAIRFDRQAIEAWIEWSRKGDSHVQ